MRWLCLLLVLVPSICHSGSSVAGEYNPVLNVGDKAPAWTALPGTDDQAHSLGDLNDRAVVVVVFTCNSCPYAVDYEQRLVEFQRNYAERGVTLVAINVNQVEEDQLAAMKVRATERGFLFPYLYDATQQIARDYGAGTTPEFFVLNRDRQVVYMGAMDDSPDGEEVHEKYVEKAVEAALKGASPEVTETVPIGCRVRFERPRRTRR